MRGLHAGRTEEPGTSQYYVHCAPKELRSARGRLVFQTASASSLLGAHSFFVPSTENPATQAGMDGAQTVGSSPLLRVATCGLREHTAVAMTTNKAVFV